MPQGTGIDISREAARAVGRRPPGTWTPHYQAALQRYLIAIAGAGHEDERDVQSPSTRPPVPRSESPSPKARVGDYCVADVMTRDVVAVPRTATFHDVLSALQDRGVSCAPVVDNDRKIAGVVSMSDLLAALIAGGEPDPPRIGFDARNRALRRKAHAETAAELMSSPAVVVAAGASVVSAARVAARARVHQLPVVDAAARLVGIVSRSDLMRAFVKEDDEIRKYIHGHIVTRQFCLDPATIEVAVHGGVVDLTGEIEREAILPAFLDAVRSVAGVVNVHSQLSVRSD